MGDTDGSDIKKLVEHDGRYHQFIDRKFAELDTDNKGTLTNKELEPIMGSLGGALGLPPLGESKQSDHIYDEIFSEFAQGKNVSKETFASVLKDVFLGLADGLERDPIKIISVDGTALREYANSPKYEADAVSSFTLLDTKTENRLPGSMLIEALKTISVGKGMPPAGDPEMKDVIRQALIAAKVNVQQSYDQIEFIDLMKVVIIGVADVLNKSPLDVAHSEKVYDGKTITSLLKDKKTLDEVLEVTWQKMPKDKKGKVSKVNLRVGVDEISPAAGLPPVGAVDEMDDVLKTVFSKIDLDQAGTINREEFDHTMLEVLGSLMLQLEGKPVAIENSKVVDQNDTTGRIA